MAQPKAEFNELHPIYTTYKCAPAIVFDRTKAGGSVDAEKAVKKTTVDREVALVADADQIFGLLKKVEPDNHGAIHEGRYIDLPGDGSAINIGDFVCGGAVAGQIRAVGAVAFRNAKVVAAGSAAGRYMVQTF